MSESLPDDLIFEILLRSPVKVLIRFRRVCKAWSSMINDPDFMTRHLNINRITPAAKYYANLFQNSSLMKLSSWDLKFSETPQLIWPKAPREVSSVDILGTCDGVLCMSSLDVEPFEPVVCLINLSIRKLLTVLGSSITPEGPEYEMRVAFGFDAFNVQHKIVRIFCPNTGHNELKAKAEVFELGAQAWRTVGMIDALQVLSMSIWYVIVNGASHWLVDGMSESRILSFDFNKDNMGEIEIPADGECGHLMSFRGYLSCVVSYMDETSMSMERCKIWVMKEYGLASSWSKLFSVETNLLQVEYPLCFGWNGELLLVTVDGTVASLMLDKHEFRDLGIQVSQFLFCPCFESFLLY